MDLVLRFVLGGVIVSVFAVAGEILRPKAFAGLFGASPSVAVATLALAFHKEGPSYVVLEARSMVIGGIALCSYSLAAMAILRFHELSPWLGAALLWLEWLVVAFAGFAAVLR